MSDNYRELDCIEVDGTPVKFNAANVLTNVGEVFVVDDTLSISGAAADAKVTGDKIDELKEDLNELGSNFPIQNLMPLSDSDETVYGVSYTYSNGILTPSGTATSDGGRLGNLVDLPNIKAGTYTISAFPMGTGNLLQIFLQNSSNTIIAQVNNGSYTFTLDADTNLYIGANVVKNKEYNVPVGITLVEGSTAPSTFIGSGKREVIDVTARQNYTKTVHIMNSNGGITDANDAEINRIYLLINVSNVSHLPVSESGLLVTFARDTSAILQCYITSVYGQFWYRRKWSTSWTNWNRVPTISDIPTPLDPPLDVLPMFDNITCCGDSLTYSQVYTSANTGRQAKVPYPKVLEKICGTPTTAYASPGFTPVHWWNAYNQHIVAKTNQLAIVYLGTNAGLTDTLDTDAPGMDVTNYDKTTNTGAYCSIVKSFLDVGAKVVLVKLYTSSGDMDTTNSVIKKIADKFSCGLAESADLSDMVYHYYPDLSGYNVAHYNDIGYSAFARKLANNIANMDKNYLKFIIPS